MNPLRPLVALARDLPSKHFTLHGLLMNTLTRSLSSSVVHSAFPSAFAFLLTAWSLLSLAPPAMAQESSSEAATGTEVEEASPWTASVGFSYLSTGGNTDTSSLGLKLEATREPGPWGIELKALGDRADQDDQLTAERFYIGARATRALAAGPELFAGLSFEQDEFSGIDLRTIAEAGVSLTSIDTDEHKLVFDLGLTYTDEDRLAPDQDSDGLGAVLGLKYDRNINEHVSFSQAVTYFPNFEDSEDWRAESLTALTAALTEHFAMQLGYEIRHRNQPVGDREDKDTSAKASLVWKK